MYTKSVSKLVDIFCKIAEVKLLV